MNSRAAASRFDAHTKRTAGFTLIEVMVAIILGVMVAAGARLLLNSLADQASRLSEQARRASAEANGERLVRGLAGRLEISRTSESTLLGDAHDLHFKSWCRSPRGWLERCQVALHVVLESPPPVLELHSTVNSTIVVWRARRRLALTYLLDASNGGIWFDHWSDSLTTPRAIGVVIDDDTLIIRIGERG